MESEGSGNWLGLLINAYIFNIIGGILMQFNVLMSFLAGPGWGYDMAVGFADFLPPKAQAYTIAFN